jgi:hypothetical protein
MTGRRVRGGVAFTVVVLAGLVLSGCGSANEAGEGVADRAAEEPQRPGTGEQGTGGGKPRELKVGAPARVVIHTGRLELEVKDVARTADEAIRIAEAADGYVGEDSRDSREKTAYATVTLRIPAAGFQNGIRRLASLGKELEREITAKDVSETVVDLDSRIATLRASVKRTRALLDRAGSISDIAAVERELSSREAELAALESRRRNLANQVAYSSITVSLMARSRPPTPPAEIGFGAGLGAGWDAFTLSVRVLLAVLGAVLPFLMYGVPVVAIILLVRRWQRRPRAVPAVGPATGQRTGGPGI